MEQKRIWFLRSRKKRGSVVAWYNSGQKKHVANFKNSKKHGLYTEWNEDGRLTKDIEYDMGMPLTEYVVEYQGDGYLELNRRNGELSVHG